METIKVVRDFAGRRFQATARYASSEGGWYCTVGEKREGWLNLLERRGPVGDAWSEMADMMKLATSGFYDTASTPIVEG